MKKTTEILNAFKKAIATLYGEKLYHVVLYGSRARGDFHEESDYDLMIVLNEDKINMSAELTKIITATNSIALKYNVWLSHTPVAKKKFMLSEYSFYKNVREEGKIL